MAAFGFGVVVAPVLGPTLGGWITETYTWRWSFYINIPIGIFAVMMISRLVTDPPHIRDAKPGKFDGIGLGLLALWLGALQIMLDKGQEDDWFASGLIRWMAVLFVIGLVGFLWRELRISKPLVDLRVMKYRNFAIGCLQIALFGGVVYGMVTLLPLFFQTLMGYTALASGIAVAPRGIGAIIAMPLVGILMTRIDPRRLISIGFLGVGICNLWLGHVTLDIAPTSLFWAITTSGFFLGFVFVPLATVAMGTLPDQLINSASGIYNLFRNLGGSIGISIVNTLIARHSQVHREELVHSVTLQNPLLRGTASALQRLMATRVDPVDAMHRAIKLVELTVDQQAALWSYVDDFRYLAVVAFCTVPIGFLLKKVSPGKTVAAD